MDDVMDSGERTDAALAMFSGKDDAVKQPDGEQSVAEAQPGAEPQSGGEQPAAEEVHPGQISDEQLQADPRYQELSTFKDSIVNALSEFPGLIDDKGNVNAQETGAQLKDASVLYDIMQGKGAPSSLLEIMAQNAGWTAEQKRAVAQDLIGWLQKSGYLKEGAPAQQPGVKDPLTERLDKIENDRKTEVQRAEQQKVQQHQEKVFNEKFLPEVQRLCKQKGIPQEDFPDYVNAVAQQVAGNKAILARIEKGNYVDLNRFFTQKYNSEAKRLERWTKAQTAAADKKSKNPRIPAGGAPPAPGGAAKGVNPRDRDSRIAAATDML